MERNCYSLNSFNSENLAIFLTNLGYKIKEVDSTKYILDPEGNNVVCAATGISITTDNIGVITKGSIKFYSNLSIAINEYLLSKTNWV